MPSLNRFVVVLRGNDRYAAALDALAARHGCRNRNELAERAIALVASQCGVTLPPRAIPNGGKRSPGVKVLTPEVVPESPQVASPDTFKVLTPDMNAPQVATPDIQVATPEVVPAPPEPRSEVASRPSDPPTPEAVIPGPIRPPVRRDPRASLKLGR